MVSEWFVEASSWNRSIRSSGKARKRYMWKQSIEIKILIAEHSSSGGGN